MKKVLFSVVALVITITADAQTRGVAKATIKGKEIDIEWVQLWAGGPKFATRNLYAKSETDGGKAVRWSEANRPGKDFLWGDNWRCPTKEELDLLNTAKVTEEYCYYGKEWGFMFKGVQPGYTENYIFINGGTYANGNGNGSVSLWASTSSFLDHDLLELSHYNSKCTCRWGHQDNGVEANCRPILNE